VVRGVGTLKLDLYFLARPVRFHLGNGLYETKRLGHLDRRFQAR
jgi:hypothetical protein